MALRPGDGKAAIEHAKIARWAPVSSGETVARRDLRIVPTWARRHRAARQRRGRRRMLRRRMFDRFTNDSKQLLAGARQQALELGHDYIAPEHLLLSVVALTGCRAQALLLGCGQSLAAVRDAVLAKVPRGKTTSATGQVPFTPRAKQVLELMLAEAVRLDDEWLGSEHVLLGLAASDSIAGRALGELGLDVERLRAAVLHARAAAPAPADRDRSRVRALLISNSTMHGGGYLQHCAAEIADFLGDRKRVLFFPYALRDHDAYADKAAAAFAAMGRQLESIHRRDHAAAALQHVDAVFVGGGNTFRLLQNLQERGLLDALRERCMQGLPYIGSSAGTNVATPTIRTTNDMPIVQPTSFAALHLVPFQINPHYLDADPASKHMGETREERLRQFHEENATPVLGLREGCMLRVEGLRLELRGSTRARLFVRDQEPREFAPPCDLSFLLAGVGG